MKGCSSSAFFGPDDMLVHKVFCGTSGEQDALNAISVVPECYTRFPATMRPIKDQYVGVGYVSEFFGITAYFRLLQGLMFGSTWQS